MAKEADLKLAKTLRVWAWVITVAVLFLVGLMRQVKIPLPEGVSFSFLPPIHASLNALTAVVLIFAFRFIKQKKVEQHRKAIYLAFTLSVGFLLSYVLYQQQGVIDVWNMIMNDIGEMINPSTPVKGTLNEV